jgi:hypothetical protein
MIRSKHVFSLLFATYLGATIVFGAAFTPPAQAESLAETRTRLNKEYRNGNFKDAYDGLRALLLETKHDPKLVGPIRDLRPVASAVGAGKRIRRVCGSAVRPTDNWRVLYVAAQQYLNIEHHGFMISGEFERGNPPRRRQDGQRPGTRSRPRPATDDKRCH